MKRAWQRLCRLVKARKKAERKEHRDRRNAVFKMNINKFGVEKAKMMAACATRKQKGEWKRTWKSAERYKAYRRDSLWFAGESWAGPDED